MGFYSLGSHSVICFSSAGLRWIVDLAVCGVYASETLSFGEETPSLRYRACSAGNGHTVPSNPQPYSLAQFL
jgi:hypothetical protein